MLQTCPFKLSAQPGKHYYCLYPFAGFLYNHGIYSVSLFLIYAQVPFYHSGNFALLVKLFALLLFSAKNFIFFQSNKSSIFQEY